MDRESQSNSSAEGTMEQPATPKMTISIESQDGDQVKYEVSPHVKLQYTFQDYCELKNLDYETVVFLYEGKRINSAMSPVELGIQDEDIIDAMLHMVGGGSSQI